MLQWTSLYIMKFCHLFQSFFLKIHSWKQNDWLKCVKWNFSRLWDIPPSWFPEGCASHLPIICSLVKCLMFAPSEACGQHPREYALCWDLYGKCCLARNFFLLLIKQIDRAQFHLQHSNISTPVGFSTSLCIQNRKWLLNRKWQVRITKESHITGVSFDPKCQAWRAERTTTQLLRNNQLLRLCARIKILFYEPCQKPSPSFEQLGLACQSFGFCKNRN